MVRGTRNGREQKRRNEIALPSEKNTRTGKPGLSPDRERSMQYINKIIVAWQSEDPGSRGRVKNTEIAEMVGAEIGVEVNTSNVSNWRTGKSVPSEEFALGIARAFKVDPYELFEALGHTYVPPVTFRDIYEQAKVAIEEWADGKRPYEDWKQHSKILWGLALYFNEEWLAKAERDEDGELLGWLPVAETVLIADIPLVLKAHQLLFLAEAEESYRKVCNSPNEYNRK